MTLNSHIQSKLTNEVNSLSCRPGVTCVLICLHSRLGTDASFSNPCRKHTRNKSQRSALDRQNSNGSTGELVPFCLNICRCSHSQISTTLIDFPRKDNRRTCILMRSLLVLFYSDTLFLEATSTSEMCVMLLSLFLSGMGNIRLLRNYNLHLLTISEMLFTRGHGDIHMVLNSRLLICWIRTLAKSVENQKPAHIMHVVQHHCLFRFPTDVKLHVIQGGP